MSCNGHVRGKGKYEWMIWKASISSFSVVGCNVWWLLSGWIFFGFFQGRIVMYRWVSHSISVAKSCGGACKKLLRECFGVCINLSHIHCNLDGVWWRYSDQFGQKHVYRGLVFVLWGCS